jgi:hypothetical protein
MQTTVYILPPSIVRGSESPCFKITLVEHRLLERAAVYAHVLDVGIQDCDRKTAGMMGLTAETP